MEHPVIAVVDDDESVRTALRRLLRSTQLQVETFASGASFLEFVQRALPACVVLDLHMPGLDGWAVQAELAGTAPNVPVIMITGDTDASTRNRALARGAVALFPKPIDAAMLLAAINAVITPTSVTRN
jgi:FixJ family two-component response regulator